jgi:uncharacterized protein with NAD-binding domain and iron-sulfur cluster
MSSGQVTGANAPQRVVILGGGPAGVSAAYWLSHPGQKGKYKVSLYTQGWRLGGKCASGRDGANGDRIEEHGLHMLMGCYQNGFATVRSCYLDWREIKKDPESPFQTWKDAFTPLRQVTLMEQDGPGDPPSWLPWNMPFLLQLPGEPGDGPLVRDSDPSIPLALEEDLIHRLADWMTASLHKDAPFVETVIKAAEHVHRVLSPQRGAPHEAVGALKTAAEDIQAVIESRHPKLEAALEHIEGPVLHRLAILAKLGVAVAIGYMSDIYDKGPEAWLALDAMDFRAWLKKHGAGDEVLASAPVAAFYDLAFGSVGGESPGIGGGSIAAGSALRAQMEMVLGYRNAPLWKMNAGMGDTVFTPFYDVLTARGVEINFFSRVSRLRSDGNDAIGQIDISTQAVTVDGGLYCPTKRVLDLDCWPNQPFWDQLKDGAQLQAEGADFEASYCTISTGTTTLKAGEDFDLVILAIPPDSIKPVIAPDIAQNPAWSAALGASTSVATQSLQLWMKPDLEGLGWTYGTTAVTGYAEPYDSWGDMSQVIHRETWPAEQVPGSIGYLCGAMADMEGPVDPPAMEAAAVANANRWMTANLKTLWPDMSNDPVNDPRILSRYSLANFDLSDRYVQTPPGNNVSARFDPAKPAGYSNLYVVGDWTKTRFSGGAFESAVESAMLAARGISGFPAFVKSSDSPGAPAFDPDVAKGSTAAGKATPKKRIAILGGGMASLTAAYQLTKTQALRDLHEVTLYQMGWRLGGKAASSRNDYDRNIEHGLHVWFGFYENTFQMVQEVYAARDPHVDWALKTWQDAVRPQNFTPIGINNGDGTWSRFPLVWPSNLGTPGEGGLLPTVWEVIETIGDMIILLLEGKDKPTVAAAIAAAGPLPAHTDVEALPERVIDAAMRLVRTIGDKIEEEFNDIFDKVLDLVGWAHAAHGGTVAAGAAAGSNHNIVHDVINIFFAVLRGISVDIIVPNEPLISIDDMEFSDWLLKHGADPKIVANSSVVRAIYDTTFQYAEGDAARRALAAGTGLGTIMRIVGTYKGSCMWLVQAGMGEVIVGPLYQHLLDAGVKFEFFHKVSGIEPGAPGEAVVSKVHFDVQAEMVSGEYEPVTVNNGLVVWPHEPYWDQLANGTAMKAAGVNLESNWNDYPPAAEKTIALGTDFDVVVLGIALGALKQLNPEDPSICAGLIAQSPAFANWVNKTDIIPSMGVQLWSDKTLAGLGWADEKPALVSGPEYLNIWADMSQVLAFEGGPAPKPKSLHYLTGTYKTQLYKQPKSAAGTPAAAAADLRAQTVTWLNRSSQNWWPLAQKGGQFDWSVLNDPASGVGEARLDGQYLRANIDPTECCTLAAPGVTQYRLHADGSGFTNLILCGEGTAFGLTTSFEGAVMSGAAASRAICGSPAQIIGYDFLERKPSQGAG